MCKADSPSAEARRRQPYLLLIGQTGCSMSAFFSSDSLIFDLVLSQLFNVLSLSIFECHVLWRQATCFQVGDASFIPH